MARLNEPGDSAQYLADAAAAARRVSRGPWPMKKSKFTTVRICLTTRRGWHAGRRRVPDDGQPGNVLPLEEDPRGDDTGAKFGSPQ